MSKLGHLYSAGLKPVYKEVPSDDEAWHTIPGTFFWKPAKDGFQFKFNHEFDCDKSQTVYFAFTFPFGYEEWIDKVNSVEKLCEENDQIYFHREWLIHSLEKRPMELLTITDVSGMIEEEEPFIKHCFPLHKKEGKARPKIFEKPTVFLSARVHPGETPASHVLNGILDLLTDKESQVGKALLKQFVFKIVPLLNPDGVARWYYRLDTKSQNLNRYYTDPKIEAQPTIFAVKKAIEQQNELGKLKVYIDLHAHASKRGWFMFGNHLYGQEQVENLLLPKLISLNSINFDFQAWGFNEGMMNWVDKRDGLSREGSGRVGIWKATGIVHWYTLECHYASGVRIKKLAPRIDADGTLLPETDVTNINSDIYENGEPPEFNIEIFEDVGRAVWAGLLDLIEANPQPRLTKSEYKNLAGVRKAVEKYVDDTWGLDEQPESKTEKRVWQSLPRVAMMGPKNKAKSYEEKVKEEKEQKQKERQRLDRIRQSYLQELKERREKEMNKDIEGFSQISRWEIGKYESITLL